MKSSFTVSYRLPHQKRVVILGVTSIMPNLNGVLFQTEDREGEQVESYQMNLKGYSLLPGMFIEYSTEEDIEDHRSDKDTIVKDHRA